MEKKQKKQLATKVKTLKVPVRRKNYRSVIYRKAIGKTIQTIEQAVMDEDGGWSLELSFTDGTILVLEMRARLEIQAQYLKEINGALEPV